MSIRVVRGPGGFRAIRQNSWLVITRGIAAVLLAGCSTGQVSATGGGGGGGKGGKKGFGGGDVPVTVATATQKNVPVEIQVIGNVEAYSTISVKAQVGGELTKV